ncbi:major allergen Pru ar 1 [Ricinus communis]|uniref:Major allergen Pru ar, putative n=1 Tax=Ricinus communis TaxID=3988 RepID=B9RZK2_RICCO|nr:major allergen Pru ar 1 [Ricinus communis]EEF43035.1 Major allergen Pru ar, putative [Ricinus communis]|eukprot:XP_002519171.1 major allergen Pru ar 1 [Ricinus communis]
MGVVTYEMEVATTIPAAKMFKAFVLEGNTLIARILPQAIKSIDILEGDGGAGTIKQINFGDASQFKYAKERTDAVDKENLTYAYTMIEGDVLIGKLEKISNEIKFEATPDGGCLIKSLSKYYTIGDFELKQEDIKAGKEKSMGLFKAVEGYLLANPDA